VENKKSKSNKKVKCYSFFGPIEGQIIRTCKLIYIMTCTSMAIKL